MNVFDNPWHGVFFAGLVVYSWIRRVFIKRTAGSKKVVSQIDAREKILLAGMVFSVMFLPTLYLFTPLLSFADYQLPAWTPGAGVVAMVLSLWLFWRSHADLGLNWSVSLEARENHELITHGVYRRIRHPMYASIWLWALAQGLMLQNWLAGWLTVVAFAAMYLMRTPREERLMLETFGEPYRDYMRRTGSVVPRLGGERKD